MALFQKTKLDKVCREIAEDLAEYRSDEADEAAFEAWVRRRVIAYTNKAKIVQKRHIHLLCFWEASLGPERFTDFRNRGLKQALTLDASESERMDKALRAFRRFLEL